MVVTNPFDILFLNSQVIHGGVTLSDQDHSPVINIAFNFTTKAYWEEVDAGKIHTGKSQNRNFHYNKNSIQGNTQEIYSKVQKMSKQ